LVNTNLVNGLVNISQKIPILAHRPVPIGRRQSNYSAATLQNESPHLSFEGEGITLN